MRRGAAALPPPLRGDCPAWTAPAWARLEGETPAAAGENRCGARPLGGGDATVPLQLPAAAEEAAGAEAVRLPPPPQVLSPSPSGWAAREAERRPPLLSSPPPACAACGVRAAAGGEAARLSPPSQVAAPARAAGRRGWPRGGFSSSPHPHPRAREWGAVARGRR